MDGVTAVILAGGLGTRLRSRMADRPKVLAEVCGRPFLSYLLDQMRQAGVAGAVLCTGHLGDQVEAAFGPEYRGLRLKYSREETPLGTGGALRLAAPLLDTGTALVMNGDSYFGADLSAFHSRHADRGADASLLLTRVPDTSRYGRVSMDDSGLIRSFEKKGAAPGPGWINAGIYLLDTGRLMSLPSDRPVSLEREAFPSWIGWLYGHPAEGRFLDIGTPETLDEAQRFFARGAA
jgi:D-glycero-alpha-D-manno-heptose 1-phosphate guanylyltransferase